MSRSGYSDDGDYNNTIGLYRHAVDRAIAGKRGQAFMRELAAALDAMPVKELIAEDVVKDSAHVCALGSVAVQRGLDVSTVDVYDGDAMGGLFGIARSLACEVAYMNDERGPYNEEPAARWKRMRAWVQSHLPSPSEGDPR